LSQISRSFSLTLVAFWLAMGCQKAPPPEPVATAELAPPPAPVVVTSAAEARHIFDTRCVVWLRLAMPRRDSHNWVG